MDRTTSFAKSVEGLHHEPSALDRVRSLGESIARWFQGEPEPAAPTERTGSRMVQEDAPVLQPTPAGPMRWQTDHVISYGRVAKEREHARRKLRSAEMKHEFQRTAPTRDRAPGRNR